MYRQQFGYLPDWKYHMIWEAEKTQENIPPSVFRNIIEGALWVENWSSTSLPGWSSAIVGRTSPRQMPMPLGSSKPQVVRRKFPNVGASGPTRNANIFSLKSAFLISRKHFQNLRPTGNHNCSKFDQNKQYNVLTCLHDRAVNWEHNHWSRSRAFLFPPPDYHLLGLESRDRLGRMECFPRRCMRSRRRFQLLWTVESLLDVLQDCSPGTDSRLMPRKIRSSQHHAFGEIHDIPYMYKWKNI